MGRTVRVLDGVLTAGFFLFHVAASQLLMPDGQLSDTIQLVSKVLNAACGPFYKGSGVIRRLGMGLLHNLVG